MQPASIFIVEDEAIVAKDLSATLVNLGYSVAGTAKNSEIAMEKITETKPDLVLMDIHIAGDIDGVETAGKVHNLLNIPVVYLTAHADDTILARAKVTEPYGYIIKPFEERGLQSTIEMALYKHAMDDRLLLSEATIRGLLNATKDETVLVDNEGKILALNDAFAKSAGKPAADLVKTVLYELIKTGGITMRMADEMQKKGARSPVSFEEELHDRWLDTTIYPINNSNGTRQQVAIFRHDITAIKLAERELNGTLTQLVTEKEHLALYAAALDNMRDCVIITGSMGDILYVNATTEKKFGIKSADMKDKKLKDLAHPENQLSIGDSFFFDYKDSEWQGLFLGKNVYGMKIPLTITGKPIQYYNKKPTHFVFVLRDKMS